MDHTHHEEGTLFVLPTPTDTPYRTPSRSRSRQSHRHGSTSPDITSPTGPLPPDIGLSPQRAQEATNPATDEKISPFDPRGFTPSLHASLVSEILSLRREVESKTKDIEDLEASICTNRDENEILHETVASTSKERRALQHQIQLLEGGNDSALGELSKHRDDALNESAELRKRLELSQKKLKGQEESAERIQMLWERDRGTWQTEKRSLETKVHIIEGRLKVVLREIATSHMVSGQVLHQEVNHHGSPKKMHLRQGSAASLRSIGVTGRRRDSDTSLGTQEGDLYGYRLSMVALANGHSTSLADELAFDEEQEEQINHIAGHEGQISAAELPEKGPTSPHSRPLDLKARRILGLASEGQSRVLGQEKQQRQSVGTVRQGMTGESQALCKVQYVNAAIQYSPPASPKLSSTSGSPKATEGDNRAMCFTDVLSYQEQKTALKSPGPSDAPSTPSKPSSNMISTSCQTSGQLPSPPWTPPCPQNPATKEISATLSSEAQMISTATQTDNVYAAETPGANKNSENAFQELTIPIIAIHPPASRPTTPTTNVVLPPHTKNVSCQVNIPTVLRYTTSSMQTEEIRGAAPVAQLPQELSPSKMPPQSTDNKLYGRSAAVPPANPLPNSSRRRLQQPVSGKPVTSRRRVLESTAETTVPPSTPEVEDPVTSTQAEGLTSTSESSALLRASENQGNGEHGEPQREKFDEGDIFSRPTAKFILKAGKLVSKDEPESDYQDIFNRIDAEANEPEQFPVQNIAKEMLGLVPRRYMRGNTPTTRHLERKSRVPRTISSKQPDIRKTALISRGTAAHQSSHARNPSAPANPPPFPVPTRHSSRKPPLSLSEGAQSPTPIGRSPRKRDGKGQKPVLRKVKSTTSVSRASAPDQQRRPSPPLPPSQYDVRYGQGLPLRPMPLDDTTTLPLGLDIATFSKRRDPIRQESHSGTNSANTALQQTSVVDAIAQTMVGEWMYKYVRRRKSFGVPEPKSQDWDLIKGGAELSASITNTGIRHKRWVWLAPYERAVMWSSKQPTSGSALMGKSGRKLVIQSVLDVRDDNPLPKGSGSRPHFNRSILILTPERALKFTATSQERHYVWVSALSFLSHSPLGLGELTAPPNIPQQEYSAPRPLGGSLQRNSIRDSIRVAKGRDGCGGRAGKRSVTTDGVIPQYQPEREALFQHPGPRYEPTSDAADPPTVPRYTGHTRHRSNTAPRAPSASFRSFSVNSQTSAQPPPSTYSMATAITSDVHTPSLYNGHLNGLPSAKSSSSRRGSESSGSFAPQHAGGGYFDHITPTMRMEAFISEEGAPKPRGSYRTRQGRKKNMGYWGVDLPDEVVGNRARSPAVQCGGNPGTSMKMNGQHEGRSMTGGEGSTEKRHVIQEDLEFDGHAVESMADHFRGF